jgi:hypothetical protein
MRIKENAFALTEYKGRTKNGADLTHMRRWITSICLVLLTQAKQGQASQTCPTGYSGTNCQAFDFTEQSCKDATSEKLEWTPSTNPNVGYAGTCTLTGDNEFGLDKAGEIITVVSGVLLVLKNCIVATVKGASFVVEGGLVLEESSFLNSGSMQVNGYLHILENSQFGNMGSMQVNGFLHIDGNSHFYNVGSEQTIIVDGKETDTGTGAAELNVKGDFLLYGDLTNSGSIEIETGGTYDICTGSVKNVDGATFNSDEKKAVEVGLNPEPVEVVAPEGFFAPIVETAQISTLDCVPKPPQTCPTGYSGTNCEIADDCLATDVQDTTLPNEIYCDNLFASGKTGACECVQGADALADALALALGSSGASLFSPSLFGPSLSLFGPLGWLVLLLACVCFDTV